MKVDKDHPLYPKLYALRFNDELTLEECGRRVGLSRQRVHQILGNTRRVSKAMSDDERRRRAKLKFREYRLKALEILGGECVRCGYDEDWRALQIDHIDPICQTDEERRGPYYVVRDVINGKTDNLQILCANCNRIKVHENGEYRRPAKLTKSKK